MLSGTEGLRPSSTAELTQHSSDGRPPAVTLGAPPSVSNALTHREAPELKPPSHRDVGIALDARTLEGDREGDPQSPPGRSPDKSSTRATVLHALARAPEDRQRLPILRMVLREGARMWWALPLVLASKCSARKWEDNNLVQFAIEIHSAALGATSMQDCRKMLHALRPHPMLTALVAMIAGDQPAMHAAARHCSPNEICQLSRIVLSSVARDAGAAAAALSLNLALWFVVLREVELEAAGGASADGTLQIRPARSLKPPLSEGGRGQCGPSPTANSHSHRRPPEPPTYASAHPARSRGASHVPVPPSHPAQPHSRRYSARGGRAGRRLASSHLCHTIGGGEEGGRTKLAESPPSPRRIMTSRSSHDPRTHSAPVRSATTRAAPVLWGPTIRHEAVASTAHGQGQPPSCSPAQALAPSGAPPAKPTISHLLTRGVPTDASRASVYHGEDPSRRHPLHDVW
jgi:hypothetical protein